MEQELQLFVDAAERLEDLKGALAKQKDATERIRLLSETIGGVSEQIGRLPPGLSAILNRAETAERRIDAACGRVEELRDSIPALVTKIEQSDVGRSIDALKADIAASREDIRTFREASTQLQELVQKVGSSNQAVAELISAEFEKTQEVQAKASAASASLRAEMLARFDQLQVVFERAERLAESSAGASANAFSQTTSAIRGAGDKQAEMLQQMVALLKRFGDNDMSGLRHEVGELKALLTTQAKAIEVLSKKKGITF